ncbi:ribonuclease 1 [Selaginella moellendorffii]|nr:ribonuclease 1 [Selaginella moellendorffii]|eukprot:XP_002960316.2 ribonuclease 1 [Selaginella moellendorffii]
MSKLPAALLVGFFTMLGTSSAFDFFYLVLEWPGSYCDAATSCCYPQSGKPASDFSIHGLWPNNLDGSYPENCDPSRPFNASQIGGLRGDMDALWSSLSCPSSNSEKFWAHEWEKHGTCSEKILRSQRDYFAAALRLRKSVDLLGALEQAGISPDGKSYPLALIKNALQDGGYAPGITCNADDDDSGSSQLYQIYLCVSKENLEITPCPVLPRSSCHSRVEFPVF